MWMVGLWVSARKGPSRGPAMYPVLRRTHHMNHSLRGRGFFRDTAIRSPLGCRPAIMMEWPLLVSSPRPPSQDSPISGHISPSVLTTLLTVSRIRRLYPSVSTPPITATFYYIMAIYVLDMSEIANKVTLLGHVSSLPTVSCVWRIVIIIER